MANPVVWFEVMGRDGTTLRKFYSELFGWRIGAADPSGAFDYGLVEPGYGGIAGGIGSSGDAREQLGGRTVLPVTRIPGTSFEVAHLSDPDGHVIGLTQGMTVVNEISH